jgi:hypothetical protein
MVPLLAVWVVLAGVMFVQNYDLFASYYIRGHLTGGEVPVRRLAAGLVNFSDDIVFYPNTLRNYQLTSNFFRPAAIVLGISAASGLLLWPTSLWRWRRGAPSVPGRALWSARPLGWLLGVTLLSLLACYGTLTVAEQKSPVVAGPFIAPIALLVVGVSLAFNRASFDRLPWRPARLGFLLLGPIVIVLGLSGQWQHIQAGAGLPPVPTLQAYTQIVDDTVPYIAEAGGRPIVWSIDGHYVEISYSTIQVFLFERTGQWANLAGGGIGYGALEHQPTAAELLQAAQTSDVLILAKYPPGTRRIYPYDQSVQDQHDVLEQYAQQELTLLGTYEIRSTPFFLYVRPHPATGATAPPVHQPGWRASARRL